MLERIYVAEPNVPFFATVLPGKYLYYTLNLTEVGTDVTVVTTKFFGTVDLFLSARQVLTLLALLVQSSLAFLVQKCKSSYSAPPQHVQPLAQRYFYLSV